VIAARTWVALVHHPVYDKHHRVVATALTNLDLHDIARSSRTFGLAGFLIVHPVAAQRELAARIAGHWLAEGAEKNDFRRMAIERITVVASIAEARAHVAAAAGEPPLVVATSAQGNGIGYRALVEESDRAALILFGTGWGLTDEALAECERKLAPIGARSDYNHLSVRSACAIVLDRLYGDRENYAPSRRQQEKSE
jgi:hypothetical protein